MLFDKLLLRYVIRLIKWDCYGRFINSGLKIIKTRKKGNPKFGKRENQLIAIAILSMLKLLDPDVSSREPQNKTSHQHSPECPSS